MSSQPPSNGNMVYSNTLYGIATETFYSDMATLWLMDYDLEHEIKVASQGVFSCTFIISKVNPILTTSCKVDVFHWPVAKDAPIIRIGQKKFMFAVPGLLYALQLPQNCSEETLNNVVMFFRLYARYEDRREIEAGTIFPLGNDEEFWKQSRQASEQILLHRLAEYGYHPPRPIIYRARQCSSSFRFGRLSTVAQTINHSILLGSIEPENVEVNVPYNFYDVFTGRAFPCIRMFTNIVDAMQLKILFSDETYALLRQVDMVGVEYPNSELWSLTDKKVFDLAAILCQMEEETLGIFQNIDLLLDDGNSSDNDSDEFNYDYDEVEDDDYDGDDVDANEDASDDDNDGGDEDASGSM